MMENNLVDRFGLIDVNSDFEDSEENYLQEEELQRTDNWRNARNGCWTASTLKNLMTCNPRGGKMCWSNPMKSLEFSSGSIKVIYEVAKSRQRGYFIESSIGKSADYGTKVEPLIYEISKDYFKKLGLDIEKVGFVKLSDFPTAGVSSDFRLIDRIKLKSYNGEIKATTSWGTHYERTYDLMDEKSIDFWQVQMQMKAHEVDTAFYVVSEPPRNINKYLYSEDIMLMLEDFRSECALSYQKINASEIHQKAFMVRIEIAEKTVQRWLEEQTDIKDILYEEIDLKKSELKEESVFSSVKVEKTKIIKIELEKLIEETWEDIIIKEEEVIDISNLPEDFSF